MTRVYYVNNLDAFSKRHDDIPFHTGNIVS